MRVSQTEAHLIRNVIDLLSSHTNAAFTLKLSTSMEIVPIIFLIIGNRICVSVSSIPRISRKTGIRSDYSGAFRFKIVSRLRFAIKVDAPRVFISAG